MLGAYYALASAALSYLGSKSANDSTNRANLRNTRENNAFQERLSRTAHQREVKDLRSAGLNPILSARGSGAPQPSSAAAKVEPKPSLGSAAINAAQIQLLHSQARKTSAEALNTELQEPYNRAIHDIYDSILGVPTAGMKTLGSAASAFGVYQGGKAVSRMLKSRKAKKASISKPVSRKSKFIRSRGGSNSRSAIRRKSGLKFHERVDKSTGEIKPRWSRAEALRKAGESTKYGLRRFGGRRRIRF